MSTIQHRTPELDQPPVRVHKSQLSPSRPELNHERPSVVQIAKTAADDLLNLLSSQIKLARFELASDVRAAVGRAMGVVLLTPVLLGGYLFAMAAIASALSGSWGRTLALTVVALLQIVVASAGMAIALWRLNGSPVLERTRVDATENVKRTLAALSPHPGESSRV